MLLKSRRNKIYALPMVLLMALTGSCAKKRSEQFVQGQGEGLSRVEDYDGKEFQVSTGAQIGLSNTTLAEDGVKVAEKEKSMNAFNFVSIQTDEPESQKLLGSVPFRGRENTKGVYKLVYRVTNSYLKLYKVAKKEDLPFQEHFYIEETMQDGSVMIPMLGYKLKYFRLEKVKNDNDETTHRLIEIEVPSKVGATHVRVDFTSREVFEPILKIDIFPKNLFRGEWYFAETVVDTELASSDAIGQTLNEDHSFGMATKIRFYCRENELRVLSLSQDERLQKRERGADGILREVNRPASAQDLPCSASDGVDLKLASAVQIPISWVDYRLKAEGMDKSLKAEKATDRSYSERPYLELKLASTKSVSSGGSAVRLINVEVDENYFGYTLLVGSGAAGAKIRFSFLRSGAKNRPAYTSRPHFKEDRKVFGFFTTSRPFIADWEYSTEQDFDRRIMMNRFNPNNTPNGGEIQFHFSANTPAWLREVGVSAVEAWDRAFQEAFKGSGRSMRVTLGKGDVQLGDLRYNVINLIDQLQQSNLFGFGPSISDPDTGEIISATSNVHVGSVRSSVISAIRGYIITRAEGRKIVSFAEAEPVPAASATQNPMTERLMKKIKNSNASASEKSDAHSGAAVLMDAKNLRVELQKTLESGLGHKLSKCQNQEMVKFTSLDQEIQNQCPEIEAEIDEMKATITESSRFATTDGIDKAKLDACATRIIRTKVLGTLIHEMGHNLGLRHNFKGSIDKANFAGEGKIKTTSIMEYTSFDQTELVDAGPYDVAAIRFGYAEQVQLSDGKVVQIDAQKPIQKNLVGKQSLKKYAFCTDEDRFLSMDPLCNYHDSGTTPLEIVENYIREYRDGYWTRNIRRDQRSGRSAAMLASYHRRAVFQPMKRLYDEWRYKLSDFLGRQNGYLTGHTPQSYARILDLMAKSPTHAQAMKDFKPAADAVFNFFLELATEHDLYCEFDRTLASGAENKLLVELTRIHRDAFDRSNGQIFITSCADPRALAYAQERNPGLPLKYVGEYGTAVDDLRFGKADRIEDVGRVDIIGREMDRSMAWEMLASRHASPVAVLPSGDPVPVEYWPKNILEQFAPSILDEPDRRMIAEIELFYTRMGAGVIPAAYDKNTVVGEVLQGRLPPAAAVFALPQNFQIEQKILMKGLESLYRGSIVPNRDLSGIDSSETRQRLGRYMIQRVQEQPAQPEPGMRYLMRGDMKEYRIPKGSTLILALLNKYEAIEAFLQLRRTGLEAPLKAVQAFKAFPPQAQTSNLKLEEMLAHLNVMNGALQSQGAVGLCIQAGLKKTMTSLEEMMIKIEPKFTSLQNREEQAAFLGLPLSEVLKSVGVDPASVSYPFSQENFSDVEEITRNCVKVNDSRAQFVMENADNLKEFINIVQEYFRKVSN